MKTLSIQGSYGRSDIHVGESLDSLAHYIPKDRRAIIITDAEFFEDTGVVGRVERLLRTIP